MDIASQAMHCHEASTVSLVARSIFKSSYALGLRRGLIHNVAAVDDDGLTGYEAG